MLKGMELSQGFYELCKEQLFAGGLGAFRGYLAMGLVGEGSECYGYDDELSQDHDFGPDFCIWIPEKIYQENRNQFIAAYDALPMEYRGYRRDASEQTRARRGIMTIEGFYQKYTGILHAPANAEEWFRIPQGFLAVATNGAVFEDSYGEFTRRRNYLLAYYPEDVIRKKLAAKAVVMGQAGQYNYVRCCRREEWESAYLAGSEFVGAALSAVYLLNKKYMPFYKWAFRGTDSLSELRHAIVDLKEFVHLQDTSENAVRKRLLIEDICNEVACALRKKGYSTSASDFLASHGNSIMEGIRDVGLRSMHVLVDYN
ncbi:MAG: DUF4037 domain-containing protein [Lachnospiraceae bacterium]|nr:DUF4037 domain-containing protein [Lachnospiraceae bacterium]